MTTRNDKPDPRRRFFTRSRVCQAIAMSSGIATAQYLFGRTPITWPQAVLFFIAGMFFVLGLNYLQLAWQRRKARNTGQGAS